LGNIAEILCIITNNITKNVTGYNTRQVIKIKKNTDNTDWFDGIL